MVNLYEKELKSIGFMKLVADDVLEASGVVANCRMNRDRILTGSNGYERDLRFNPLDFLAAFAAESGRARWLDLCCGSGRALIEAAGLIEPQGLPIEVVGVDLAGMFAPSADECPSLRLIKASLTNWQTDVQFDLITCVHGLHYVGDKLRLIAQTRAWLSQGGRFAANLDLSNFRLRGGKAAGRVVAAALRKNGFEFSSRTKLLTADGYRQVRFPFAYLGADDTAGPNYTGQPAVDSYYEALNGIPTTDITND